MDMSDTPETDSVAAKNIYGSKYKLVNVYDPWISKPDNRGDVGDLQDITDELNELLRERDEALEEIRKLKIILDLIQNDQLKS